jgi:hypothetical protein
MYQSGAPQVRAPAQIGAHRATGTVYGRGAAPSAPPSAYFQPPDHLENSGSLTGHILAQGAADRPTPKSRTAKVILIMVLVFVVLVGVGLLAGTVARDAISNLLGNLFSQA